MKTGSQIRNYVGNFKLTIKKCNVDKLLKSLNIFN